MELEGRDRITGELRVIRQHVCDEHYADLTTTCAADACERLGVNVIAVSGHSIDTGEHREDEMRVCDECLPVLLSSKAPTINGVRMVRDGNLRFRMLPANPGRG